MTMNGNNMGEEIYVELKATVAIQIGRPADEVPLAREIWKAVGRAIELHISNNAVVTIPNGAFGSNTLTGSVD